ncbi:MAG: hypothetical protein WA681_10835, partial [Candidatus Acidiferrales bacterium]
KYFNSRFNSFWCCTGTGAEEFSKLGDSIYFRNDHEAFVNLFIASEVRWPEKGLTIHQDTSFPDQDSTALIVKATTPVEAGINIRIPSWAVDGGSVTLNGQPLSAFSSPGSYIKIDRTWADGDRLDVKLPMRLHTEGLLGDPTQQAVMYGPIVLAGRLGQNGLTEQMQYDVDNGPTDLGPRGAPSGTMAVDVKSTEEVRSAAWVEPVQGEPMTFRTVGQPNATTLIPLHRVFGERYGVYWKVNRRAWWMS